MSAPASSGPEVGIGIIGYGSIGRELARVAKAAFARGDFAEAERHRDTVWTRCGAKRSDVYLEDAPAYVVNLAAYRATSDRFYLDAAREIRVLRFALGAGHAA